MMTFLSTLATIFGLLMALANVPQGLRILRRKSAKDISLITYSLFGMGSFIWFLYGLEIKALPMYIANGVGTLTVIFVLICWYKYK